MSIASLIMFKISMGKVVFITLSRCPTTFLNAIWSNLIPIRSNWILHAQTFWTATVRLLAEFNIQPTATRAKSRTVVVRKVFACYWNLLNSKNVKIKIFIQISNQKCDLNITDNSFYFGSHLCWPTKRIIHIQTSDENERWKKRYNLLEILFYILTKRLNN